MPTRRRFLEGSLYALLWGCTSKPTPGDSARDTQPDDTDPSDTQPGADTSVGETADTATDCPDPFETGEYLESLVFTGEPERELEVLYDEGLDGRYVTDLTTLDVDTAVIPNERFFVRTRASALLPAAAGWTIRLHGLVEAEATVAADELAGDDRGVVHFECSGNTDYGGFGLQGAAAWSGEPLADVLARVTPTAGAARVMVTGFDTYPSPPQGSSVEGAAWIFTLDQLADAGAFLATGMNGEPLPADHGGPVRLVVPGWYGCCSIKWVEAIEFVADDAPATSQMQEFAARTHQTGTPALARDYAPAVMGPSALPIRVEKWRVDGEIRYRVVGILWGAAGSEEALVIRYDHGEPWVPLTICPARASGETWVFWTAEWIPSAPGDYTIQIQIDDPSVETIRLDAGYYARTVRVDEV